MILRSVSYTHLASIIKPVEQFATENNKVRLSRITVDSARLEEYLSLIHIYFAELLSEWLGELNVSHTGGRYSPKGKGDVTSNRCV